MEAELRKLTCADLEAELVRIKQAKIITDDYLKEMKSLSKAEIQALTDLKKNLNLLKQFEKLASKQDYSKILKQSTIDYEKAIKHMKKTKAEFYDPRELFK